MKVVALVNQKGGVGKTTTATSLSFGLVKRGFRVLAIDFDPQGNLTSSVGASVNVGTKTAFEWLCQSEPLENVVQKVGGLDIIPAHITFSQVEVLLQQRMNRERVLKKALSSVRGYDYVIIDGPPSLGLITINILTAVDEIIVPLKTDWLSYEGARQLLATIAEVKSELNSKLRVAGFLRTMVDSRRNLKDINDLIKELAEKSNGVVFGNGIRMAAALADAPSYSLSIFDYQPNSKVAADYNDFVDEYLKNEKGVKENAN